MRAKWWIIGVAVGWALVVWMSSTGVIFEGEFTEVVGGWLPMEDGVERFRAVWKVIWFPVVKGWHVFQFFCLTLLGAVGLRKIVKWSDGEILVMMGVIGVSYALVDEWHQTFVPGRGGRLEDVAIDAVGVGLALWFLSRRWGR